MNFTKPLTEEERALVDTLRRRFYQKYPHASANPMSLLVTSEENEAYCVLQERQWGSRLTIRNESGEHGLVFKGVPLLVGGVR